MSCGPTGYEHIVMHYPTLHRFVVFFKEGGAQSFDMEEQELPNSLRKYIRECREALQVNELSLPLTKTVHQGIAGGMLPVTTYSKSLATKDASPATG